MEQSLERALYEVLFALAEFRQSDCSARQDDASQALAEAGKIETLDNALRLSLWGLETALRALRDIDAAQARHAG